MSETSILIFFLVEVDAESREFSVMALESLVTPMPGNCFFGWLDYLTESSLDSSSVYFFCFDALLGVPFSPVGIAGFLITFYLDIYSGIYSLNAGLFYTDSTSSSLNGCSLDSASNILSLVGFC